MRACVDVEHCTWRLARYVPASKRLLRVEEIEADCAYAFGKRPFRPFVMEVSLQNCYGLQSLSTFLHIPFLCLKRAALEQVNPKP